MNEFLGNSGDLLPAYNVEPKESFTFRIQGPPASKERPRFANGRAYTPATTKTAEKHVREAFELALRFQGYDESPVFKDFLCLEIKFVLKDKRRRDIDNMVKLVQDALNKVAYEDDWQIHQIVAEKSYAAKGAEPYTEVKLSGVEPSVSW